MKINSASISMSGLLVALLVPIHSRAASEIDLAIAYTHNARDAAGGDSAMRSVIWRAVDSLNQVCTNSLISQDVRFRFVHVADLAYAEPTDPIQLWTDLASGSALAPFSGGVA